MPEITEDLVGKRIRVIAARPAMAECSPSPVWPSFWPWPGGHEGSIISIGLADEDTVSHICVKLDNNLDLPVATVKLRGDWFTVVDDTEVLTQYVKALQEHLAGLISRKVRIICDKHLAPFNKGAIATIRAVRHVVAAIDDSPVTARWSYDLITPDNGSLHCCPANDIELLDKNAPEPSKQNEAIISVLDSVAKSVLNLAATQEICLNQLKDTERCISELKSKLSI